MIHIACIDLSKESPALYERLLAAASPDRKQRCLRYRRFEDAFLCAASEALIRYAAANKSSAPLSLQTAEGGKPYAENLPGFHFSLSHSGCWAVIAWGSSEVGIDVEQIAPGRNVHAIARRWFSPEECAYLAAATDSDTAFATLWTARESILKYFGTGFSANSMLLSTLTPPNGLHLSHHHLAGNYCLCLCSEEEPHTLQILQGKDLL